jgi:hypothetical protein
MPRPQPEFRSRYCDQFLAKRFGRDDPDKVKLTGTYRTFIRNRAEV